MNTKTQAVLARAKRAAEKYENTPSKRPISDAARKQRAEAMQALAERKAEIEKEQAQLGAEIRKIDDAHANLLAYYHW